MKDEERKFVDAIAEKYCRHGNCTGRYYDETVDAFVLKPYFCCGHPDEDKDGYACGSEFNGDGTKCRTRIKCVLYFCPAVIQQLSNDDIKTLNTIQLFYLGYEVKFMRCRACNSTDVIFHVATKSTKCYACGHVNVREYMMRLITL